MPARSFGLVSRDYSQLILISVNNDVIDGDSEDMCEQNHIIQSRHCLSALPLVYRLRCGETEYILKITYCEVHILSESCNISPCSGRVDDRYAVHVIFTPVQSDSDYCFQNRIFVPYIIIEKRPPASYETSGPDHSDTPIPAFELQLLYNQSHMGMSKDCAATAGSCTGNDPGIRILRRA